MYSSRRNSRGSRSIERSLAPGGARHQIELERTDPQRRIATFRRSAQQRLDPGNQLDDRERLGQIVVAAGTQPAHAVVDRTERAQDQNRGADVVLPQGLDDGEAVHAGQQAVDDHDVGPRPRRALSSPSIPGRCPIDLETAVDELGHDLRRGFAVILDQEHLRHKLTLSIKALPEMSYRHIVI